MRRFRRLIAQLNNFIRGGRADRELNREVAAHLALMEEGLERSGMSAEAARRQARRAFGGVEQAKQLHREERTILWMEHTLFDLRYAWRNLWRTPGFTAVTVLTLALGIGANIAIFTVVNAVLLRPLPFREPDRLVRIFDDLDGVGATDVGMSVPELEEIRDRAGVFDDISALWPVSTALGGGDHAERIEMLGTGFDYFQLLGAQPALGRVYGPGDAAPGFGEAVVISDGLWKRQFGADPRILGQRIRVDEDAYTVAGVMPADFRHPGETLAGDVELWAAAGFRADPFPMPPVRARRMLPGAIARLKPGLSLQQAQQRADVLVRQLTEANPNEYPAASRWRLRIEPVERSLTSGVRPTLVLLLAAVGSVLLIVAVNMASLLVARSSTRVREVAIRQAMGATRARLVRQMLTESVLLSMAGGLAAMVTLAAASRWLQALMPTDLPRLAEIHFDARVLGVACLLSLITGILFGLTPALRASGSDPNTDLKEGGRSGTATHGQNRFRGLLVGTEIALSVVLLSVAGVLVHSFWNALRINPGYDAKGLLVARIWIPHPNNPKLNRYLTAPAGANLSREILRRVKALPGVEEVAMGGANSVPLVNNGSRRIPFLLPDQPDSSLKQLSAEFAAVSPEFFHVLRTPVLRGRSFTDADSDKNSRVAMVNESFSKQYLGGRDLGQRMNFFGSDYQIIGVVADMRDEGLDTAPVPRFYRPMYQGPAGEMAVFLRAGASGGLKEALQGIVRGVDADLPVYGVRTMEEMMATSLERRRFSLWLIAGFAGLALFLASIGIYGVMAYAVSQRAQEFGIRAALGAAPRDILLLALKPGVWLTLGGVLAGLLMAQVVATRLMTSLLFGVSPVDPITFVGVPAALAVVAMVACWIPVRRAAHIPAIAALRS